MLSVGRESGEDAAHGADAVGILGTACAGRSGDHSLDAMCSAKPGVRGTKTQFRLRHPHHQG